MAHILLIEDDQQFHQMLVLMLKNDGHKVSSAFNGADALEQLAQITPELIITDMLMPTMDGVEMLIQLSKMKCKLPVIAISGGRRSINKEFNLDTAAVLGVKATLPKPFTRDELRSAIRAALP